MKIVKNILIVFTCLFIAGIFIYSNKAKGLESRSLEMMCLDTKLFKDLLVNEQKVFLLGTMDRSGHVIEVYRDSNLKWMLTARTSVDNEVCVIASGPQLFLADHFIEQHLP